MMIAYTYTKAHTLQNFSIEKMNMDVPVPGPLDVLVKIRSISFNPVDTKRRRFVDPPNGKPAVLGWDASGIIEKLGSEVKGFLVGDEVFYAGDMTRQGCNAEFQIVDYRLIGKKPSRLNFTEAAALPLTALTAWEALFERGFDYTEATRILIIGGAGGVGSMATQLLKATTSATVIVTASRPETREWCRKMGADIVIGRDIQSELEKNGIEQVDIVFGTTHTGEYLEVIPEVLRPFGNFVLIDDPGALDISSFKKKALSVHWELMFTKSMFNFHPEEQGYFLGRLAAMVDQGSIQTTLKMTLPNSLESIRKAHELLESGIAIGKIVMDWQE